MQSLVRRWESNTISPRPRLEIVAALVIAPLLEEAIFRLAVLRIAAPLGVRGWPVALASATLFALMHVRFGGWFVGYAFAGGLVLSAAYARAGYPGAVLLHLAANLADLSFGWRRRLYTRSKGTP